MRTALLCLLPALLTGAPPALPLDEGRVWVYQGPVRWAEGTQVREQVLTWRMAVKAVLRRGPWRIARVAGWPGDLAWYHPGKRPGFAMLLAAPGKGLHLREGAAAEAAWSDFAGKATALPDAAFLEGCETLLPPELKEGAAWGEPEQLTREDGLYAWRVEAVGTEGLGGIGGWPGPATASSFRIAYRTHPDHTTFDFVPGLGITRYTYVHHGTVSGCDLRLVAVEGPTPH